MQRPYSQEGTRLQTPLLQSERLLWDGKFLELHILSLWRRMYWGCWQLAGVTFNTGQAQHGPCLPLQRPETRPATSLLPSSLRLPFPLSKVQTVAKGLAGRALAEGGRPTMPKQGDRKAGEAQRIPISLPASVSWGAGSGG